MTAKEFFKSTAFKCICVLLSIVLICGILLTICNALFAVSDQERLDRAISKIYGETVEYDPNEEVDEDYSSTALYTINQVYPLKGSHDGEYLLNITGNGGYGGGTVTCWVVANINDGEFNGISKVTIDSNSGQSYIAKIGSGDLQALINQQENSEFTSFTTSGISTGATFSLNAITNCMNGATEYIKAVYCGYVSPYADYEYTDYIDDVTTFSVSGTEVTYQIKTKVCGPADPFEISVTVGENGIITAYSITSNGSTSGFGSKMHPSILNSTLFVNKELDDMLALFNDPDSTTLTKDDLKTDSVDGSQLVTGASESDYSNAGYSNFVCIYASLFASANYELALSDYAEGGNS